MEATPLLAFASPKQSVSREQVASSYQPVRYRGEERSKSLEDEVSRLKLMVESLNLKLQPQSGEKSIVPTLNKIYPTAQVGLDLCSNKGLTSYCSENEEERTFAVKAAVATVSMEQWLSSQHNHVIPAETCLTVVVISQNSSSDPEVSHGSTALNPDVSSSKPWVLAIGSCALLHEIGEITGHKMSHNSNVFLRPFKLLYSYQSKLENRLVQLESEGASEEALPADSPTIIPEEKTDDGDKVAGAMRSFARLEPVFSAASGELETRSDFRDKPQVPEQDRDLVESDKLRRTQKLRKELSCLIEFMTANIGHSREDTATASFDELWNLFRPGVLVVSKERPTQAYCVMEVTGGRPTLTISTKRKPHSAVSSLPTRYQGTALVLDCLRIDCDGYSFGPVVECFTFQPFEGRRDIASLEIYPFVAKDPSALEILQARGKKFVSIARTPGKGFRYTKSMPSVNEPYEDSYKFPSDIVVDLPVKYGNHATDGGKIATAPVLVEGLVEGFMSVHAKGETSKPHDAYSDPYHRVIDGIYDDSFIDLEMSIDFIRRHEGWFKVRPIKDDVEDIELALFPGRIWGYILPAHGWGLLKLDCISDLTDNFTSFHELVLPKGTKEVLMASGKLCLNVQEKRSRLVLLFHGPPGVGKTAAATGLARKLHSFVFSISPKDFSSRTPYDLSTALENYLKYACHWNCVVFVRDADVFLSSRRSGYFGQNGFVSAFLNGLESFPGLMILSTTRVGDIDEGAKSRIHASLYFPPLSGNAAKRIVRSNLERIKLSSEGTKSRVEDHEILRLTSRIWGQGHRWSGRQITNTFTMALALAKYDERDDRFVLKAAHFAAVAQMNASFNQYLLQARGAGDEDLTLQLGLRNDDFDPSANPTKLDIAFNSDDSESDQAEEKDDITDDDDDDSESKDSDSDSDCEEDLGRRRRKKGVKENTKKRSEFEDSDSDSEDLGRRRRKKGVKENTKKHSKK